MRGSGRADGRGGLGGRVYKQSQPRDSSVRDGLYFTPGFPPKLTIFTWHSEITDIETGGLYELLVQFSSSMGYINVYYSTAKV